MQLRLALRKGIGIGLLAVSSLAGVLRASAAGHALRVSSGVLTVDGLTVKSGLELRIANLRYLYIGLPGVGTAIIADRPFEGAVEERSAFRGNALTVMAGDRRLQLTAGNRMRGTHSAYVQFQRGTGPANGRPAVSYGDAALVPATWGGLLPEERVPAHRVKVRGRRAIRTAKLCRPSRNGREMCATIREVVYKP